MTKVRGALFRHPFLMGGTFVAIVAVVSGLWAWNSMFGLSSTVVYYGVPDAPQLTPEGPDQVVYRIDPTRSEVSYEVEENLAGNENLAVGTTKGVAGDILIDFADTSRSEVGEIVVNVQQLTSDEQLRDERIRHDYLESNDHPLSRFQPTELTGLPDEVEDGVAYDVQVTGELTVKDTTRPVTLDATVERDGDELAIDASADVLLSDFGVGPIHLIGLASTGDEATLRFQLVAVDARQIDDITELAWEEQPVATDGDEDAPSFHDEVQPILESACASCHETDAAGAPFWELETAADAQRIASGLGLAVETRYMPPWLASDESVPFQHDYTLSDEQIATITEWADAGGPLDVDGDTPVEATEQAVEHPEPDVVLAADAPYQGSTDLQNDYRCFILDPEVDGPTAITGYEFVPDQTEYVHHALVYRLSPELRDSVEQRDEDDPGTGYQCFGGVGGEGTSSTGTGRGSALVAGWAPGQRPGLTPEGTAQLLDEGEFFVVQVHYHFVHAAPADRSELVLQLGDEPADSYDAIDVTTYLGPAEIPCGPDESGPLCDRDAALADLADEYGPSGAFIANGLNRLCGTTPEEIGVLDGSVARSSCDHPVRRPGQILGVLGHMHEIGATFRMTLNPDTPEELVLLDIPRWDFNWQLNYAPTDEIVLEAGDVIRVECSWDRDLIDPALPDRYVLWSEGTEDEMCYSTITTREPSEAVQGDG